MRAVPKPAKRPRKPKKRLPRKRSRERRRPDGAHDPAYLAFVRGLECVSCGAAAPNDPDHMGQRGIGQKAPDHSAAPMCRLCNGQRTDGFLMAPGGCYQRADKGVMRMWCAASITLTRMRALLSGETFTLATMAVLNADAEYAKETP